MEEEKAYKTFKEFYPYYLKEHTQRGTRVTHFIGTSLFFVFLVMAIVKLDPLYLLPTVIVPYAFAWVGHFFIEKNKPATFQYPGMSLRGDFKLYFDILLGKQGFSGSSED
ncbi:MAG: hypothetical protein COB85_05650 [Bacteroidetes bacterium]|nr:MAG: hypothetical protein COB85_05650 [Bacteroidota bacterium]